MSEHSSIIACELVALPSTPMSNLERYAHTAAPYLLSVLRIMAALLLLQHGTQKLLGFPPMPPGRSAPEFLTLIWFAGFLELVGGAACPRSVQPHDGVHPVRRACIRLLDWPRTAWLSSDCERGRIGGSVLLRLPLSRRCRARTMECGQAVK